MDTLARGLRCAAKILEDNVLPRYVKVSIIHLCTCPYLLCCMLALAEKECAQMSAHALTSTQGECFDLFSKTVARNSHYK